MIYTGNGLTVRICAIPTPYDHWMSFACYASIRRYLPDAVVELVVFGRPGVFFDWARRLRLRIVKRSATSPAPLVEADDANVLAILPTCIAVREWIDSRLNESWVTPNGSACLRRESEMQIGDLVCADAKADAFSPLADVSGGVGEFVPSRWIDTHACFLAGVNTFRSGSETPTESAVFDEWHKAIALAGCLGLNRT